MDKASKKLWKAIDDEVKSVGLCRPKPSRTFTQITDFAQRIANVKSRKRRPKYHATMNFDEKHAMHVEVDKDLGVEYSDTKRSIQWYTEEKRGIKQ